MSNRKSPEKWMQDIDARQRNIVFPDTVKNEARFWRNLGTGKSTTATKLGLAVLGLAFYTFLGKILLEAFRAGTLWAFVACMVLFWGPIFGAIAWATRRSLRQLQNAQSKKRKFDG